MCRDLWKKNIGSTTRIQRASAMAIPICSQENTVSIHLIKSCMVKSFVDLF
jgi:hypothetical protein